MRVIRTFILRLLVELPVWNETVELRGSLEKLGANRPVHFSSRQSLLELLEQQAAGDLEADEDPIRLNDADEA